ncbi:MAG TPA: hypothetical protein VHY58_07515 [Streptosporangiaceae bacterium]|nr:hypothetical protein [Streptosporangiaceae bacterium]
MTRGERSGMFGDERPDGSGDGEYDLFPPSVRPAFLRLLWLALAVLAVAAGLLIAAASGMPS